MNAYKQINLNSNPQIDGETAKKNKNKLTNKLK